MEPFQPSARGVLPVNVESELPTAVQAVLEAHDTPLNPSKAAPPWFGVVCTVHLVPFQRSASVAFAFVVPTAVQAVGAVHETLSSSALVAPVGLGTDWIVHAVPFQRSASSCSWPATLPEPPTATQAVAEVHEIPRRMLPVAWLGFGTGWSFQAVPVHLSAMANSLPSLLMRPTAVQAVAALHDTPRSSPGTGPSGRGVGWIVQLVPFQRSARVN